MNARTKALALAVVAASGLVVTAAAPSGAAATKSSAYGVSVGGQPGQPYVESTDGSTKTGGGELPAQLGPLAAGGVLAVTAGNDHATSKVTDLTLGSALEQLPDSLQIPLTDLGEQCGQLPEQPNPQLDDQILGQIPGALKDTIQHRR